MSQVIQKRKKKGTGLFTATKKKKKRKPLQDKSENFMSETNDTFVAGGLSNEIMVGYFWNGHLLFEKSPAKTANPLRQTASIRLVITKNHLHRRLFPEFRLFNCAHNVIQKQQQNTKASKTNCRMHALPKLQFRLSFCFSFHFFFYIELYTLLTALNVTRKFPEISGSYFVKIIGRLRKSPKCRDSVARVYLVSVVTSR